jgi:hypothetical protein
MAFFTKPAGKMTLILSLLSCFQRIEGLFVPKSCADKVDKQDVKTKSGTRKRFIT